MDEIGVASKQFGDDKSTLLDQFERRSFEIQLNQPILARSRSEPGLHRHRSPLVAPPPPPALMKHATQGKHHLSTATVTGFRKVVKKLLIPFKRKQDKSDDHSTPNNQKFQKMFRSMSLKTKHGKNNDVSTPKDHKFQKMFRSMSVKNGKSDDVSTPKDHKFQKMFRSMSLKNGKSDDVSTPKDHKFQKIFRSMSMKTKHGKNDDVSTPKDHKFHFIF